MQPPKPGIPSRVRSTPFLLFLSALLAAVPGFARDLRVDFSGTVTNVFFPGPGIQVGSPFSGHYVFDRDAMDEEPDPREGEYGAVEHFELRIGGHTYAAAGRGGGTITVLDISPTSNGRDEYGLDSLFNSRIVDGESRRARIGLLFSLASSDLSTWTDDDLPKSFPSIGSWDLGNRLQFFVADPNIFFHGRLDMLVSELTEVEIDIKPGSDLNPINTRSRGTTEVAILGSASFDAEAVDPVTLIFGPARVSPDPATPHRVVDVNGDGFVDLVSSYRTDELGASIDDEEMCLEGRTLDGGLIEGCDAVEVLDLTPPGRSPVPGAGVLDFQGTILGRDASGPLLVPVLGIRAFRELDDGQLQFTDITGIPALKDTRPEDLSALIQDMELIDAVVDDGVAKLVYGAGDSGLLELQEQGSPIASAEDLRLEIVVVTDLTSPDVGRGVGSGSMLLDGDLRGATEIRLDPFTALGFGDPVQFSISGRFTVLRRKVGMDVLPAGLARVDLGAATTQVAILGSDDFDVRGVRLDTLRFGPLEAAAVGAPELIDADGDGREDLVARFTTSETGISYGATEVRLLGEATGNVSFVGTAVVETAPACGLGVELAFLLPILHWMHRRRLGSGRWREAAAR